MRLNINVKIMFMTTYTPKSWHTPTEIFKQISKLFLSDWFLIKFYV